MAEDGAEGVEEPDPWEIYRGREGYNRMLSEIRESLYAQIPEARGSVEIFDHLADPDREIARIARAFGASVEDLHKTMGYDKYDDFKAALGGRMIDAHLPDGGYLAIAAAWDPNNDPGGPENLTFPDIQRHARIIIHETLHGLDPRLRSGQELGPSGWVIGAMANTRSAEMFADVGAQNLLLRNGDLAEHTRQLMIKYDSTAAFGAPFSDDIFGTTLTRYDNGPFMQQLLNEYPAGRGLQSFRLEGWRETIDKVAAMRETGNPEISIDGMIRDYAQNQSFQAVYRTKIEELEAKLEPLRETLLKDSGFDNLRDFSEYWLDNMNFRGWHNGAIDRDRLSPEMRTALKAVYDAKIELCAWMENNRELFPDAARVASATRYLVGYSDIHVSAAAPPTSELTNDMLMARNWLRFRETGDNFYQYAVRDFGSAAEMAEYQAFERSDEQGPFNDYSRHEIIRQVFEANPELAQAVSRGIPLRSLVAVDRVDPNNLNDDRYALVDNFTDIVAAHDRQHAPDPEQNAPAFQQAPLQAPANP